MLERVLDMIAHGLKVIRIDEDSFMIKYHGYTVVDKKRREMMAVVKKPEY